MTTEREEFEAWMQHRFAHVTLARQPTYDGDYVAYVASIAWQAWRATRAAPAVTSIDVNAVERDALTVNLMRLFQLDKRRAREVADFMRRPVPLTQEEPDDDASCTLIREADKRRSIPAMGHGKACGDVACPGPKGWEPGFGLPGGGYGPYSYCEICGDIREKNCEPVSPPVAEPLAQIAEALRKLLEGMEASGGWEGDDDLFDQGMAAIRSLDGGEG